LLEYQAVKKLAEAGSETSALRGRPLIAVVSGGDFLLEPHLAEEIFGPFSLLVECDGKEELSAVLNSLKGQLTGTVMGTLADFNNYKEQIGILREVVGRIIFNGVPTGVEVCYAMQHGGPYPASTDSRFTSVGTDAIKRFVRPVSFQDAPDDYLPDELKDANPLNIWRKVEGLLSKEPVNK
jgi:NADP-dependent aldehyde dehydrogenase